MFVHCNRTFRADEIQFLYNNCNFTNRRLEIGTCPECGSLMAKLIEKRVVDGRIFSPVFTKTKAEKIIREHKNQIDYSSLDIPKQKKVLYGFRYGENKETVDKKTGETIITQRAKDFNGNSEVVKKYRLL